MFIKADTMAKGADQVLEMRALNTRELADFIGGNDSIWKKGDPMPVADVAPFTAEAGEELEPGDLVELRDGKLFKVAPSPEG